MQGFDNFPIFPGSGEDPFARDLLPVWYRYFQADLCITLLDVFALDPAQLQGMNIAHWMPVDVDRLGSLDAAVLNGSPGRIVAMSRHGERVLKAAGRECFYAPHALDMDTWSPLTDRDEGRARLGWDGKFVIGISAANQDPSRKGFSEQVAAFASFSKRHDDAIMMIHSRARTQHGQNLEAVIAHYGMQQKVLLSPQEAVAGGLVPEQGMVSFHGAVDVLSNCAYGEGFGLSVLQSLATGTPVVVGDSSAMTELAAPGASWKVAGQDWWNRGHNANWRVPFISSIEQAYEKAYLKARDPQVRAKARRFALRYDAEKVFQAHWKPILAALSPQPVTLTSPRQVFAPVMFRDETDMLRMRLEETAGLVDHHVIVEAERTHRGVPKPLALAGHLDEYETGPAKLTHVVAELPHDPGAETDPDRVRQLSWANEHAQRNAAWPVIDAQAADTDWILISDVDEIPSRQLLERLRSGRIPQDVPGEALAIRMRVFLHAVDWEVPAEFLPPQCVAVTARYMRRMAALGNGLGDVRDMRDTFPVITDGGHHFSWQGGPVKATEKLLTSTCHTELLNSEEARLITSGERYRTDRHAAGGLPVVPVDVDETFPAAIREHRVPEAWFRPREAEIPA